MPSARSRKDVVSSLVTEYSTLASTTSFTDHELRAIFTRKEMETINDLLVDMKKATSENQKKSEACRGYQQIRWRLAKNAQEVWGHTTLNGCRRWKVMGLIYLTERKGAGTSLRRCPQSVHALRRVTQL